MEAGSISSRLRGTCLSQQGWGHHSNMHVRGRRIEHRTSIEDTMGCLHIHNVSTFVREQPTRWCDALRAADRCKRIKIAESYVDLVVPVAFKSVQG